MIATMSQCRTAAIRLARRFGFLAVAFSIAGAATGAAGETLETFEIGRWSGFASAIDDGDYESCQVYSEQPDGITLSFLLDETGLIIAMINDAWRLPAGTIYAVTASVDRRWSERLRGEVVNPGLIAFPISDQQRAVRALRLGNTLSLETPQTTLRFSLRGSNAAITGLFDCHDRHAGAALAATPPAPSPEGRSFGRLRQPLLDLSEMRDLFDTAIGGGVKVRPAKAEESRAHYALLISTDEGHAGGIHFDADPGGLEIAEIMAELVYTEQLACSGRFASGTDPAEQREALVQRAFAACDIGHETLHFAAIAVRYEELAQIFLFWANDKARQTMADSVDALYAALPRAIADVAIGRVDDGFGIE